MEISFLFFILFIKKKKKFSSYMTMPWRKVHFASEEFPRRLVADAHRQRVMDHF